MQKDNKNKKTFLKKSNAGFALLFSILLASFLISLGISIFSVSLKEIQITTSERDSEDAYYAADSARECAIYNDIILGAFPTCISSNGSGLCNSYSENNNVTQTLPQLSVTVTCNRIPSTLIFAQFGLTFSATTTNFFQASSTSSSTPASDINITKTWDTTNLLNPKVDTTIETWGHNTEIIGRRIERGLEFTY
jgi:Tfp pilus assembly protein PilX